MSDVVRSRAFSIILYPVSEDLQFDKVFPLIEDLAVADKVDVAYVLHDRDFTRDKETFEIMPKDPHYHVILYFENPRSLSALAKKLNVKENYIKKLDNWRKSVRYLWHLDSTNKTKYDYASVIANFDTEPFYDGNVEYINVCKIVDMILDDRKLTKYDVLKRLTGSMYSDYRRNYTIIYDIVNEQRALFDVKNDINEVN